MNSELNKVVVFLENTVSDGLFNDLVFQLNKDLLLTNTGKSISKNCNPMLLITNLNDIVYSLINDNFDLFLSLLYRIDLSEDKIKNLQKLNQEEYITSISLLILKRELEKVFFRKKYS